MGLQPAAGLRTPAPRSGLPGCPPPWAFGLRKSYKKMRMKTILVSLRSARPVRACPAAAAVTAAVGARAFEALTSPWHHTVGAAGLHWHEGEELPFGDEKLLYQERMLGCGSPPGQVNGSPLHPLLRAPSPAPRLPRPLPAVPACHTGGISPSECRSGMQPPAEEPGPLSPTDYKKELLMFCLPRSQTH